MWTWLLVCKAGLSFHEDVKTDAVCKACASGCWPNAWTDASGLMAVTLCVCAAFRHAMWAVLADERWLKHGPSILKCLFRCCMGC